MPSSYSKHAGSAFCLESNEDYRKKSDSPSDPVLYLYGTNGKPACDAGLMANLGAQAESQAAFSRTGRWKGSEEVASEALAGPMDAPLTVVDLVTMTRTASQKVTGTRRMAL
jgi:hypothetical protein